jgi:uncharacterized repeat protein (TIGR03803 family)
MKKFFILLVFSSSLFTLCKGQYSVLSNFSGTNSDWPEGSLTLSDGKLYGMTYYGGATSNGNIFSIDTDGNNYKDLFDFDGTNGEYPKGALTLSGSKLYGMTFQGGILGIGNIFSIDTDGNNFKDLYDFGGPGNAYPTGSLTLIGSLLYGMTGGGGANSDGNIFSIDTNGGGYRDLFDFNNTNGGGPYSSLILSGNKFYGTAGYGGAHECGVAFSVDTNGTNYKVLINFDTINGAYPGGDLTLLGNRLYGMTDEGGVYDSGCVFSIDTDGNEYKDLFNFNGYDGRFPSNSSLTLVGGTLYGTTSQGGLNGVGVIFSIDTNGEGFTDLFDNFDSTNGEAPSGVINCGDILYGMTQVGGDVFDQGVIFEYKQIGLGVDKITTNKGVINVYPNPSNGTFTLSLLNSNETCKVEVYNVMGQQVMNEELIGKNTQIDLSNQSAGVYLYRVLTESGELVGSGKVVLQK